MILPTTSQLSSEDLQQTVAGSWGDGGMRLF